MLNSDDKNLIFSIKEKFPFFHIHWRDNNKNIEIGNYRKDLKDDFISNGCLPRKSFENRNNLHIPSIDDNLIKHFIRGYFDGDGGCTVSLSCNTKKKTQKRVYIYSASESLINEISEYLAKYGIYNTICKIVPKNSNINMYKICIRTSSYKKFYNFLYDDAILYMERKKKQKFKFIIDNTNFFTAKQTQNCKFCNSSHVVCDGFTYGKFETKQNYLCRNCGRHFSAHLNSNIQNEEDELLEG